ncbi:MAG: tRNA (adenosine(37)-N6)-dimethylallyltransferase MiaA [Leptospiraceae bacterium]
MHLGHTQHPRKRRGHLSLIIPVLAGPTGAGKTDLVNSLDPERFEIISLDSRQIYRYLTIGTAAPNPETLKYIKHHLVGIIDPDQTFTAMEYRQMALASIQDVIDRNRIPMLVGGAGFYLQMLITGPFDFEEDPEIRNRVKGMEHSERLELLLQKDPECIVATGESPSQGRIHPNDAYRVERYLIMVLSTNKTMKELWEQKRNEPGSGFDFQGLFLYPGEEVLWQRLEIRASEMIEQGILEEARSCRQRFGSCPGLKILGYPEALSCVDGDMSKEELKERLWIVHRQYARRQRIWFQKRSYVKFVDSLNSVDLEEAAINLFSGPGINH